MRKIAHISDLHFGTENQHVLEGLIEDLGRWGVDLLVLSGDLTQRARTVEFRAAREFLDRIPLAKVIVPGNHDLPLYNVFARFWKPLAGFRRWISGDEFPGFVDAEVAVLGINTARAGTWKEGRVSLEQIQVIREVFQKLPEGIFKVLVSHHPFVPPGNVKTTLVGRADLALKSLAEFGCDLILSGHLHHSHRSDVRTFHTELSRSILVAQAGTAISNRRRSETNNYNLITLERGTIALEVRSWVEDRFEITACDQYIKAVEGWRYCVTGRN